MSRHAHVATASGGEAGAGAKRRSGENRKPAADCRKALFIAAPVLRGGLAAVVMRRRARARNKCAKQRRSAGRRRSAWTPYRLAWSSAGRSTAALPSPACRGGGYRHQSMSMAPATARMPVAVGPAVTIADGVPGWRHEAGQGA